MKNKLTLFPLGIIGVLLLAAFGILEGDMIWGLLLMSLFFIGEPWYKPLKKRKAKVKSTKESI